MKSGREVMKGEMEGKWKIAGIVTVAMLVISVLFAVMPASAADSVRVGPPSSMTTIYQGEKINITGVNASYNVKFYLIEDSNEVYKFEVTPYTVKRVTADIAPSGHYHIKYVPAGSTSYTSFNNTDIVSPSMEIKLLNAPNGKEITATTKGKTIYIDTSMLNIPLEDVVKIKHKPEGGNEETITKIDIKNLTTYGIDTSTWDTGKHEVWIKTVEEESYGLDKSSNHAEITIYKEEIKISEVEPEEPVENEEVRIKITAPPNTTFHFSSTDPKYVMITSKEDNPLGLSAGVTCNLTNTTCGCCKFDYGWGFNATTDENGECVFVLKFTEDKTYTLRAWYASTTYGGQKNESMKDHKDVTVSELEVTLDVPSSAEVGETVSISGDVPAGKEVTIYIEGRKKATVSVTDHHFEWDWDTSNEIPGSKKIHVYVDVKDILGIEPPADEDDLNKYEEFKREQGRATIRLISPGLSAGQQRNIVALGDDYVVNGTATGVDRVNIVIIGPKGFSGDHTNKNDLAYGLMITDATVAEDNTFKKEITIPDDADTGRYTVLVLSPARGGYGSTGKTDLTDALVNEYSAYLPTSDEDGLWDWLSGNDVDQIISLISSATIDKAGSDDIMYKQTFKAESPYVKFNPVESVSVGEPLNISGLTNREPETPITISTISGPAELPTVVVEAEWPTPDQGVFSATIDTTNAVPGTYTLEADDGDGHTDTVTVEILAAVPSPSPSPSPTVSPTPTPTPTPTPSPSPAASPVAPTTPTPTPSPSPSPTPGFEAIFAVAGLLTIAYLVLRRRK